VVDPGGPTERILYKANHLPLTPGVPVRCITAGGGGYGPPWERDVQRVVDDLLDGYISREAAETVYGVRFRGDEVDPEATRQARERMRGQVEEGCR
jgi:N-methylhydantoinase B